MRGGDMNESIDIIIKKLEAAQDMMYRENYSEANTLIYEAQSMAQFIKDAGATKDSDNA